MNFYEIAKTAYCTEGDQFDCRDCPMCQYFIENNYDPAKCRAALIRGLVHQIEELKKNKNDKKG